MKRKAINFLKVMCAVFLICVCAHPKATVAYDGEILRFHVLGNSNAKEDVALKLKVRDRVLKVWGKLSTDAKSAYEAENVAIRNTSLLREAALDVIDEEGFNYDVRVGLGVYPFPTKTYGNVTLPAGNYNAVRIVIGEGRGNNWWCVMYPPLCFVDETYTFDEKYFDGLSDNTIREITPKINIQLKILEIIKKIV